MKSRNSRKKEHLAICDPCKENFKLSCLLFTEKWGLV